MTHQLQSQKQSAQASSKARFKSYWIYALMAQSGERKACYIGQTVNLKRRFREHLRPRVGRSSFALFEWANSERVEVFAAVLLRVDGDQSRATQFEGYWLKLAAAAGFEAPDAHKWGNLPLPGSIGGLPTYWPSVEILAASYPLTELVEGGAIPVELFLSAT